MTRRRARRPRRAPGPTRLRPARIVDRDGAARVARRLRRAGRRVVFTNGVFDLLHVGHVTLLEKARRLGDFLIVGVNSDRSVRRLKGPGRPVVPLHERLELLAALEAVDCVVPFGEPTPARLIAAIRPGVLVKGGDYRKDAIVGREVVEAAGGRVVRVPLVAGRSSSKLVARAALAGRAGAHLRAGTNRTSGRHRRGGAPRGRR
jgi:D-beta-D-heptose 7-phosphate kinase/D-beta-D-heptose 1-phosphate adenosyltransferase